MVGCSDVTNAPDSNCRLLIGAGPQGSPKYESGGNKGQIS